MVLDAQLPLPVRTYLEERFWRPIEAQASLEALCGDPAFLADPGTPSRDLRRPRRRPRP